PRKADGQKSSIAPRRASGERSFGDVGDRRLRRREKLARPSPEHGVMCPGGRPDSVVLQQSLLGEGRNRLDMADRRNATDRKAGTVADQAGVGALELLSGKALRLGEIQPARPLEQEKIELAAG